MRVHFAVLLAIVVGCHKPEHEEAVPTVVVRCVPAQVGAVDESVVLRGRIAPPPGGDLSVASQVPGRIVQVAAHEGQHIARGELVASIDDAATRDAVRQAEAGLAQAHAADVNAVATLERTRALVTRGIAAKQELDDATAKADNAKAGVNAAVAAADLARRTLGRVDVRSSFDGVVTRVWRGPGALVDGTAATPIIQLAASAAVEFVAEATGRELVALREGQTAKVELGDGYAKFEGALRTRPTALDPATGLAQVRIAVTPQGATLPLGSLGRVVIVTAHRDDVLQIPSAALRGAVADGSEAAVCKDGKIELRTLTVGWRDDKTVEVLKGLSKTDRVAIDHVLGLENGTPIAENAHPVPEAK